MQVKNKHGKTLYLDQDIAGGGEARIWTVKGKSHLVAKIYHKPSPETERKITAMVANPPDQPWKHKAIAWPEELLYRGTQFVGFLMPRVDKSNTIINVYNPKKRQKLSPGFHWGHLHHTACNLASAIEAIHVKGHVIGDLNESNILVNRFALLTLVDTDSFQVRDQQGFVHRCTVGKPEYTPPELQGISFKTVDRTPEHDLFGLAVLIFHLLMEGVHPFAGVLTSQMSVGRVDLFCIKQGLFSYQNNNPDVSPPPHALPFAILHPEIQQAFISCFVHGHKAPSVRPTAREWRQRLERVNASMLECHHDPLHWYPEHLRSCPWCDLPGFRQQPSSFFVGQQQPLPSNRRQTQSKPPSRPKPAPPTSPPVTKTPTTPVRQPKPSVKPGRRTQAAQKHNKWLVGIQWLVLNLVIWVIAGLLLTAAYGVGWDLTLGLYKTIGRVPTQAALGGIWGTIIGVAQWSLLRKQLQKSGLWIMATLLPCGIAWAFTAQGSLQREALCGTLIGLAQWMILRRELKQSGWWFLVTPLSWITGMLASQWILQQPFSNSLSVNDITILNPAIQGFLYGTLTGGVLTGLLRIQRP